jgi:hypothetical protein
MTFPMPTVSNVVVVNARKKLAVDFLAYRKLERWEIDGLLSVFCSSKQGRKMLRTGGQVQSVTTIGGRDPI